jgi:TRAP-type C4-dicarboxylate transport system permease small subunit
VTTTQTLTPLQRGVMGLDRLIGLICLAGAGLAALAILACLFIITYSVGMRYVFNAPQAWTDESVGYLLVASVMASIAYALRKGEHIAVDILTEKLPPAGRAATEIIGLIAVAIVASVLLFEAYETVAFSKMVGLRSNGSLAAELYLPQMMMPIGFGLLLLAALSALLRRAVGLSARDGDSAHFGQDDEVAAVLKKSGLE